MPNPLFPAAPEFLNLVRRTMTTSDINEAIALKLQQKP